jgi:serine/threonine protein kinase
MASSPTKAGLPWPAATQQLLEQRGYSDFEQIGYGSYSTVFKATKAGKKVAIKFINLYTTTTNYRKKFFPRELEATRNLKNVHLVPIHEVIAEKAGMRYFIVMELCKSDLLKEVEVTMTHSFLPVPDCCFLSFRSSTASQKTRDEFGAGR